VGGGVFSTDMSDKEMVLEQIRRLPEDTPLERLLEEVEVLAAIRRGEQAADAGRVRTHAEVKRLMDEWTAR
jgi:predicted transcriptional regulator